MSQDHRSSALKRFFGGNASNIPGLDSEDLQRMFTQRSDAITKAEREKTTRQAIEVYKLTGIIPDDKMLDRIRSLMVDEAKKAGTAQPTEQDVRQIFEDNALSKLGPIDATPGPVGTEIQNRLLPDEEYLKFLHESLGTEQTINDLVFARRNMVESIGLIYEDSILKQQLQLVELERELGVLEKQNASTSFAAERQKVLSAPW